MKHIEVVAAIIIYEDKVLCMQRDKNKHNYISFKYEFPGGKIEKGEDKVSALTREIKEEMELEIDITEDDFFYTVEHQYPDFKITMHSYLCKVDTNKFVRTEHVNHIWSSIEDLHKIDWAGADIPIVKKLQENKKIERLGITTGFDERST